MNLVNAALWLASRARTMPCDTVVLHATAGSTFAGAFSTLKLKGFSYHAIGEDERETNGKIVKCVPLNRVAFHAGKSFGPHGPNVNNYSVGYSFVNRNDGLDPYSEAQFEACRQWIEEVKKQLPLKYLTTHAIISPGRKTDPRGFPARQMALETRLEFWTPPEAGR